MIYKDRKGNIINKSSNQDKLLSALYSNAFGRSFIKALTIPQFSKVSSKVLKSKFSKVLIDPFIKSNNINMDEYKNQTYNSYNDFFTRTIKQSCRPINMDKDVLISPSDGKVMVYKIDNSLNFKIKNSYYSVYSLLQNKELAKEYLGGTCVVIRLSVDNYHHYCYPDNAAKGNNTFIEGKLHTVNPIAFDYVPVFKQNSREYCVLETENFDKLVQIEVGALMVGKIVNFHQKAYVKKGQEKGKFEFGGSTIILLLKKNIVDIDEDILQNCSKGIETIVYMGEQIGKSAK